MTVCVVRLARFIVTTILAVALTFACLDSGIAQAQELTAHEPAAGENDSAAEASKQAAYPLANAWLMQVQQNTNWIGMPANNGNRVQSNLQFLPIAEFGTNAQPDETRSSAFGHPGRHYIAD